FFLSTSRFSPSTFAKIYETKAPKGVRTVNKEPITTITVHFEMNCNTSLQVFDINGRLIDTLFDGEIKSGTREFHWNGNNQPSGVYFIKLSSSDYNQTRKMVLLK
ncbi:MAG: T9SS type A sorting domain-containing protein, partial [Candidatus Marinimicrobia bacterium]|nr:T9SS type A sorting domain-containing protein [Candidatus Neomarinimicrobiota bacterium]